MKVIKRLILIIPCAYGGTVFIPFTNITSSINQANANTITKSNMDSNRIRRQLPLNAAMAAQQLNSIPFVQELSRFKDTVNRTYYQQRINNGELVHGIAGSTEDSTPSSSQKNTVVEYIGKLWFLKQTGLRFRETIEIKSMSPSYSSVECTTSFQSRGAADKGKHKRKKGSSSTSSLLEQNQESHWVDCSKVTCTFTQRNKHPLVIYGGSRYHSNGKNPHSIQPNKEDTVLGLDMNVQSEILLHNPLIRLAKGTVNYKISSVFQCAAESHLKKYLGSIGTSQIL